MITSGKLSGAFEIGISRSPKEWFRRINNMEKMEELISISQEKISKFTSTRYDWIQFKLSPAYKAVNI